MQRRVVVFIALAVIGLVVALTLAWKFTALGEVARPERVAQVLSGQGSVSSALVLILAFVLGGLVVFPVVVLITATAIVLPPMAALLTSFVGVMLSASLCYGVGASFKNATRRALGRSLERIDSVLSRQGILALTTVRLVPVAPFTVVNVAAGAIGVRFTHYLIATALGLLPGITVLSFFGRGVGEFLKNPSAKGAFLAVGILGAWLALSYGLQRWASTRSTGRAGAREAVDDHAAR
jgi:uncharacterized membrane protein YdjX (TVP38/TMEM64 family)